MTTPLDSQSTHVRDAGVSQLSTSFTWCCSSSCRQVDGVVHPVWQANQLCTFGKTYFVPMEISSAQLSQPQPVSNRAWSTPDAMILKHMFARGLASRRVVKAVTVRRC